MNNEQKLREAFETYITDDGKWPNAILKAPGGQYLLLRTSVAWQDWKACAEALALLTVPAISDTWGISRALVTLYAYECDGATDKALALITADHIPDAGKMIETAAPVGEREAFEREMSKPPFEFCMDRWPDDGAYAWPGGYAAYHTQCAWGGWQGRAALRAGVAGERELFEQFAQNCPMGKYNVTRRGEGYDSSHTQIMWDAWQAGRAALSAGDAVDAQRYRWLMDNCTLGIKQNGVGWILNTSACVAPDCIKDVGAAIDAAMRKGQL